MLACVSWPIGIINNKLMLTLLADFDNQLFRADKIIPINIGQHCWQSQPTMSAQVYQRGHLLNNNVATSDFSAFGTV